MSLRPAQSSQLVLGQPRLSKKTCLKKENKNTQTTTIKGEMKFNYLKLFLTLGMISSFLGYKK